MAELSLLGLVTGGSAPALGQCWVAHCGKGTLKLSPPSPGSCCRSPSAGWGHFTPSPKAFEPRLDESLCHLRVTLPWQGAALDDPQRPLLTLMILWGQCLGAR